MSRAAPEPGVAPTEPAARDAASSRFTTEQSAGSTRAASALDDWRQHLKRSRDVHDEPPASSGGRARGVLAGALVATVVGLGGFIATHELPSNDRRRESPAPGAAASASPSQLASLLPRAKAAPSAHGRSAAAAPTTSREGLLPVLVPGADRADSTTEVTYSLEVEQGIGADSTAIARKVGEVLRDRRGWQGLGGMHFVQVPPHELRTGIKPVVRIIVAGPATVDRLCAPLSTAGELSCGTKGKAVLNFARWEKGAPAYQGDLDGYRSYMINHEVGHNIGHPHARCPAPGAYAPVMLQQTKGLQGCKAWPWPVHPD